MKVMKSGIIFDDRPAGGEFHADYPPETMHMRPAIFLVELPTMTPREVALKSGYTREEQIQILTLYLEIARAEKRYAASVWIPKRPKWGAR